LGVLFSSNHIQRYAYDAWGKERNPTTWAGNPPGELGHVDVHRGFTGHEMLRHLGPVHMNGRIYDPHTGRFLSPDPFVQAPGNLQNYNRYGYVLNNPLSYTDPSGYFFKKLFRSVGNFVKNYWRPILAIAVGVLTAGAAVWLMPSVTAFWGAGGAMATLFSGSLGWGMSIAAGAIGGFAGGFVGTGTLKGALIGAFTGAAAGAVGSFFQMEGVGNFFGDFTESARALAHGITGGAASSMAGGDFRSGFLAGSFGSLAGSYGHDWGNPTANTIQAAVVGGTASVLGGGKFENGAVTSAFQHLFNKEVYERAMRPGLTIVVTGGSSHMDRGDFNYLSAQVESMRRGNWFSRLLGRSGPDVAIFYVETREQMNRLPEFIKTTDVVVIAHASRVEGHEMVVSAFGERMKLFGREDRTTQIPGFRRAEAYGLGLRLPEGSNLIGVIGCGASTYHSQGFVFIDQIWHGYPKGTRMPDGSIGPTKGLKGWIKERY
jgi:RHS repeat-associated protein